MTRDLAIIDVDGTLLDTRRRHYETYVQALEALGAAPLPLTAYWRLKRRAVGWSVLLGRSLGHPPAKAELERFLGDWGEQIEAREMLALDTLKPGVAAAFDLLEAMGLRSVLVTARRDPRELDRQLQALNLAGRGSGVVVTQGWSKATALAGAVEVARLWRWIGDTEDDIQAARVVGCPVVAITTGIRTPNSLRAWSPDGLASTLRAAITCDISS